MKTARLCVLLILAAAAPRVAAQTPQAPVRVQPDYIIGANDEISVTVRSPMLQAEFGLKNYRVQADGTVSLPNLTKPVIVAGLTGQGAGDAIRKALIESNQYQSPTVDVQVVTARNSSVTVQGAVRAPGSIDLRADRMTISDAIAGAGGFQPSAGSRIFVRGGPKRPAPEAGILVEEGAEVYRKDDVLQGKIPDARVYDGDTITVEVAPHFYVTGYVKGSQSEYNWEPTMTLNKALALAGGASPDGAVNRVEIKRKDPKTGKIVKAPLSKNDKMATPIEPDDVIWVPKKRM